MLTLNDLKVFFSFAWRGIVPRRGNPGLARGPVAVERGSLLLPASVAAPWAGRPLHGYAALGCAGRVVGWREMPLHWHLSPWRRGTPGAQLIGTHSRIPRGACAFLSASRVDTSILLSPPPSPSPLTPRRWDAFVCDFAARGCRMFQGKRCSEDTLYLGEFMCRWW